MGPSVSHAITILTEQGAVELCRRSGNYLRDLKNSTLVRYKDQIVVEYGGTDVVFDLTTRAAEQWFIEWFFSEKGGGEVGIYEPGLTRLLLQSLDSTSTFYDVGAGPGYFTILSSKLCSEGEVHAFELDPRYVEAINRSLQRNKISATVVQKAVSDVSGDEINFNTDVIPSITQTNLKSGPSEQEPANNRAKTTTLDEYIRSNAPPDVIKIDVEGFEYHVLSGARNLFENGDVDVLFLELHPKFLERYNKSTHDIHNILNDFGLEYLELKHRKNNSELCQVDITDLEQVTMLVCEPPRSSVFL